MPGQEARKKSIKYKLNAMPLEFEGKNVLLIDDSIVRGNTSKQIVKMCKDAGAKKLYFASYSPPVTNPCVYGLDIPTYEELIAHSNTVDEIAKYIGADRLFYGTLKDVFDSCRAGNPKIKDFCMACFDGKYKTKDVDDAVLEEVSKSRLCEKACGKVGGGSAANDQLSIV